MTVIFDIQHLYYLPQYIPVINELRAKGVKVKLVCYTNNEEQLHIIVKQAVENIDVSTVWLANWEEAKQYYLTENAHWVVFGNAVQNLDELHQVSKTVLMQHGIGPKACYYEVSKNQTSVRFVEGQHRLKRLQALYPEGNFVDTGYAKLDPLINNTLDDSFSLSQLGLDPTKKTLLYAPTFYPSSIECFSRQFAKDFSDFNIIVKPHFFSQTKKKYHKQRNLLELWETRDNVYIAKTAEYNLMPFMAISDVMISDASSAIFEFVALKKTVVWCDFYKLRWSYRGIFRYRFKQRLDSDIEYFHQVANRAASYKELRKQVDNALQCKLGSGVKNVVEQLAGTIDGRCSQRISEYLIEHAV